MNGLRPLPSPPTAPCWSVVWLVWLVLCSLLCSQPCLLADGVTYVIGRWASGALPRSPLRVNRVVLPQTPSPCLWLGTRGPPLTQRRGSLRRSLSSSVVRAWCPTFEGRSFMVPPHPRGVRLLRGPLCSLRSRRGCSPSLRVLACLLAHSLSWPLCGRHARQRTPRSPHLAIVRSPQRLPPLLGPLPSVALPHGARCRSALPGLTSSSGPSGHRVRPPALSPPFGRGRGRSLCQESSTMRLPTPKAGVRNPTVCGLDTAPTDRMIRRVSGVRRFHPKSSGVACNLTH